MISRHILRNLNELREKRKLCDLQLLSRDGEVFSLHKCVFVAACKRQFDIACSRDSDMYPAKMCKMFLPQVTTKELMSVIRLIYGEAIEDSEISELQLALSKLHMLDLLENWEQNSTKIKIKEEHDPTDVSVVVEVQMSSDQEKVTQAPVPLPVLAEAPALQSAGIEIATHGFNNSRDLDDEIATLKQECEELANDCSSFVEIETEEDEKIERLIDRISDELELLKTPDQTVNTIIEVNDNITKDKQVDKVKANLFPKTSHAAESDYVTETSDKQSLPKVFSPASSESRSTSLYYSTQKQVSSAHSKVTTPSKCKTILPHGRRFPVLAHFLSAKSNDSETLQGKKTSLQVAEFNSPKSLINQNRSVIRTCTSNDSPSNNHSDMQNKTIANVLVLTPLLSDSSTAENTEENQYGRYEMKKHNFIDSGSNESRELSSEAGKDKSCEKTVNTVRVGKGYIKELMSDGKIGAQLCSSEVNTGANVLLRQISKKKSDIGVNVKTKNMRDYKPKKAMTKKKYRLKGIKKKSLDFGKTQVSTKLPATSKPKKIIKKIDVSLCSTDNEPNQPIEQDTTICIASSPLSDFGTAVLCHETATKTVDNIVPDISSLSLFEQIHIQRDRKRRLKALHPLKRVDLGRINNSETPQPNLQTKNSSTVIKSFVKVEGPESEYIDNANKIIKDLPVEKLDQDSILRAAPIENKISYTSHEKLVTGSEDRPQDQNKEKNLVTQLNEGECTGTATTETSPVLVKQPSSVKKQNPLHSASRYGEKEETVIKDKYELPDLETPQDEEQIEKQSMASSEKEDTGTDNKNLPDSFEDAQTPTSASLKEQGTESPSTVSPEIAKLLTKKKESFPVYCKLPSQANNMPVLQQRKNIYHLPDLLLKNYTSGQSNNKPGDSAQTSVNHSVNVVLQPKNPVEDMLRNWKIPSDSKKKGGYRKSRKSNTKKSNLSVNKLLHIKPKLPQSDSSSPVIKHFQENLENDVNNSRKRHMSMPEVSGLQCLKKCKSVNMKPLKQKQRFYKKRNSLCTVSAEDQSHNSNCENILYLPDQNSSVNISLEIVKDGDKSRSLPIQPANIQNEPVNAKDKQANIPQQTVIVMGPMKPVVNKMMNCYEKPLFTPEQMLPSNPLTVDNASISQIPVCKVTDKVNEYNTSSQTSAERQKGLQLNKAIMKTFQSYRPIAPKED